LSYQNSKNNLQSHLNHCQGEVLQLRERLADVTTKLHMVHHQYQQKNQQSAVFYEEQAEGGFATSTPKELALLKNQPSALEASAKLHQVLFLSPSFYFD
jgi:hypothetical protein